MNQTLLGLENLDPGFYIIFYTIISAFGLCIGSFLNVVICRLPTGESLTKQNSHCVKCGTEIKWYDLIPVLSWIMLKGKCRSCGEKISPRYPIVELLNAVIYIITFYFMDFNPQSIILCLFFSLLIAIGFIDWDTQEINLSLLIFGAALAVLSSILTSVLTNEISWFSRITGALYISVPFFLIGQISGIIIKKNTGEFIRGIELGDTILMAIAGFLIGGKAIVISAFIGIIIAAICGMVNKHETGESKFAFGPFLSIGIFFGSLFGEKIIDWWLSMFI